VETLNATSDVQTDPAVPAADDLLAQLAGEDIDKLLAEAEVEAAPAAAAAAAPAESAKADPAPPPPASEPAVTADEELAKNLDELFEDIKKEETPPAPASPAGSPAAVATADPGPAAAAMESEPSLPPVGDPAARPETDMAQTAAPPADPSAEPSAADAAAQTPPGAGDVAVPAAAPIKQAYDTPQAGSGGEQPAAQSEASSAAAAKSADEDRLPFYIRFLEFLNSPLDAFSDPMREIIGKIALVTLLNSIAVIGYVLLFRRK
jgi:ribosomal protein L12E/L44/L45/RPP1/RPP2